MKNIEEIYKQKFENFETEVASDAYSKFSNEWQSMIKKPWYKQGLYQGIVGGVISSVVILFIVS